MDTPICDFVKKYVDKEILRLHMPGHKGKGALGVERLDITEVEGADVLYNPHGIIEQSQRNASEIFGSAETIYSTEGSSLCIRAMIQLACLYAKDVGRRPKILAGRNAHKAFLSAIALLDVDTEWFYPDIFEDIMSCEISPDTLRKVLSQMSEMPVAVYITSPDYLGNIADVKSLAEVCHEQGILLLVDNAHGAYLKFLPESCHPIDLGADMCCDSAHKTLPVLTGGAYLHISRHAPNMLCGAAKQAMSLFASTSPSYLILQSLDMANRYLCEGYRDKLQSFLPSVRALKQRLECVGYVLSGDEELKLTLKSKPYGYTGFEISEMLSEKGIVCELADPDVVVMMLTPEMAKETGELERALLSIPKRQTICSSAPQIPRARREMTPREAMLSRQRSIRVADADGEVLAHACISCPPAIPVLVCGEVIDRDAIKCFEYYGIDTVNIVEK